MKNQRRSQKGWHLSDCDVTLLVDNVDDLVDSVIGEVVRQSDLLVHGKRAYGLWLHLLAEDGVDMLVEESGEVHHGVVFAGVAVEFTQ